MNVAFIPVRGGSKSIPLKNIKQICGQPLVYWTVRAACKCKYIDVVYVSTDNIQIRETVENFCKEKEIEWTNKVKVIERSESTATDLATTESAMLEFAEKFEFKNIMLIQATSPLLKADDLCRGMEVFFEKGTDSVLSVVRQKRFLWSIGKDGNALPQNYDLSNRPRRQEFEGYLVENGAFYITSYNALIKSRNRISGNIRTFEMEEDAFYEIDEIEDWIIVEELMKRKGFLWKDLGKIPKIKMFLSDCDGCLTDAGMYYTLQGDAMKKFNTRDGMGFQKLHEAGIITGIITGEDNEIVASRAQKLNVDILKMGIQNKLEEVKRICKEYNISMENVAYIGDDINDLELIREVGFGCSVQNAISEIKENANYVCRLNGGEGAVREAIDLIIKYQC